jgi:hypothetical protein
MDMGCDCKNANAAGRAADKFPVQRSGKSRVLARFRRDFSLRSSGYANGEAALRIWDAHLPKRHWFTAGLLISSNYQTVHRFLAKCPSASMQIPIPAGSAV